MCDCITRIDAQLVSKNAELPVLINFTTGFCEIAINLKKRDPKKKLGSAFIAPTYCPFCGEKVKRKEE